MKSPDWVGEWFPILESQGEYVQITFGRINGSSEEPRWFFLPHRNYDGFGGLTHLQELSRVIQRREAPSFLSKMRGFLHFLSIPKIEGVKWKEYDFGRRGKKGEVAWTVFSKAETEGLVELAKEKNASLNSLLLLSVDRALSKIWTESSSSRRWLIPVDMRGSVRKEPIFSNHSSYVSVLLTNNTTLSETKALVKIELEKNSHWGAWCLLNSGIFIKRFGMRKIMRSIRHKRLCWMGTLSNLGVWTGGAAETTWFFCPPVLVTQPISLGCLIWNGRLTLSLQFHPALSDDPAQTWQSLDACKTEILRECQ